MRPATPHLVSMRWRDGLFAHWPVDPDEVRPHVPEPLELDTRDGRAWISILPFVLARAGFRFSPSFARLTFPELNLRTYVRFEGDPGLFFFSIDVDSDAVGSVVGRLSRLPVYRADMRVKSDGERVEFASTRARSGAAPASFEATYRPRGGPSHAESGSLAYWLVERRRFYAPENGGVLYGEIAHEPWPLRPAEVTIRENTLFEAKGLPTPEGDPVCHYCGDLWMTGSILRRVSADRTTPPR